MDSNNVPQALMLWSGNQRLLAQNAQSGDKEATLAAIQKAVLDGAGTVKDDGAMS